MTFLNWGLLIGLAAVAIPIIIHLLNRRKAEIVHWGAMRFLLGSLVHRNRRILVEEMLLLALRCLLLALLALAMARPYVTFGSKVPWEIVLPALLLGAVAFGVGTAVWRYRQWRWTLYGAAAGLLLLAAVATAAEHWLQLRRWVGGGERDIAIVIDGSASMTIRVGDRTNFERAVEEARAVVESAGRSDAVSVLVAGRAPVVKTPVPLLDRRELGGVLDRLAPTRGSMNVPAALSAAAMTLAEGHSPVKRIVFLTDGQGVGWDTANRARWEFLAGQLRDLSTPPKIICRTLPMPQTFRNVAVTEIRLSRDVVGPDRPVTLHVRVENTGTEAVGPFRCELRVGDRTRTAPVGLLSSGTAETVRFSLRFERPGLHAVTARADVRDDLPADNRAVRVVRVIDRLPVLIIDGNPAPRPLDRASAYIDIALAPAPDSPGDAGKPAERRVLVETTVVNAPDLSPGQTFDPRGAVILANVPKLPAGLARRLATFVAEGGGLLIAPGDRALPDFYNHWETPSGLAVPPAKLRERRVFTRPDRSARFAVSTFHHKALSVLADRKRSDIELARVAAYWRLDVDEIDGTAGACGMLNTGDPFLAERRCGEGRVLMTAFALDHRDTNLPTLQAFVPLVHEMVLYLVRPPADRWNFDAASELTLRFSPETFHAGARGGLRGDYYNDFEFRSFAATRVDPVLDLRWTARRLPRGVHVARSCARWTGSIIPRYSEKYTFRVRAVNRATLWIDGRRILTASSNWATGTAELEAHRRHDLRIEFLPRGTRGDLRLLWSSASQPLEVVPRECLSPLRPFAREITETDTAEVIGPDRSKRRAKIVPGGRDSVCVQVADAARPGLYRLRLPEFLRAPFAHLADEKGFVPFAVRGASEEGRLEPLSEVQADAVGRYTDFFRAETSEQMLQAVTGEVPGQELWRYLALAALATLLAEIALARWIARQRKSGVVEAVDFTSRAVAPVSFRDRARDVLGVGGSK